MQEKGINPPQHVEVDKTSEFYKWLLRLQQVFPKTETYQPTLTPTSVSANSESVQTFTITGLATMDIVTVNKPTNQAGLDLIHAWVSAANTLSIKYRNQTGGGITPTSEKYLIQAVRR